MPLPLTSYSSMTDDEFLSAIDSIGHHSPIIRELMHRLSISKPVETSIEITEKCPICKANVDIKCDVDTGRINLEIGDMY